VSFNIKLLIKLAVAAIVFLAISTGMTYYQPAIGGSIAVSQLQDSYSSSTGVKVWQNFKDYWIAAYGIFVIALFATDLKRLFNKN
jgi:hypothetical protein